MPEETEPQPYEIPPSVISLRAMGRRTFFTIMLVVSAILVLAYLYQAGYTPIGGLKPEETTDPVAMGLTILSIVISMWLIYLIPARSFDAQAKRHPEKEGDLVMIKGLVRALILLITTFAVLSVIFKVGTLLAVIGAFAGMFLGWSLQGPVSGFVA